MIHRLTLKKLYPNDVHLDQYTEANIISSEVYKRLFYAFDDTRFAILRHDDIRWVYWRDIRELVDRITDKAVKAEAIEIIKLYRGPLCLKNV